MPFISQSALDSFILEVGDGWNISLHEGLVPTLANELHAGSAPGYVHQVKDLADNLTFPSIVFGPATGAWPTVRSIGVSGFINRGNPPYDGSGDYHSHLRNPLAYVPLPAADWPTLRAGDAYTIPSGYLGATLRRSTGDLGWFSSAATFNRTILNPDSDTGDATGADLDPSGVRASPIDESRGYINIGEDTAVINASVNLYAGNPLHTLQGLRNPLRRLRNIQQVRFGTSTIGALAERVLPFYWSPAFHALTSYLPCVTDIGEAGTATHWVLSGDRDFPVDLSSVLFIGQLFPSIDLAANEVLGFERRSIRVVMML